MTNHTGSTYFKPLLNELMNQPLLSNYKVNQVYPVKNESDTSGFRFSPDQARKVAMQLLIAADLSEGKEVFLQGSRSTKQVTVSRYNGGRER
jgi:hypothetical protein